MKLIKAEGIFFKYIFPDEIIGKESQLFKEKYFLWSSQGISSDLYKICQNSSNTRLAIFKIPLPQQTKEPYKKILWGEVPYCLIWPNDDIDLLDLDQKVKDNNFADEDFAFSIKAHIQRGACLNCHNEYLTLSVDSTDYYFALDKNGKPDTSKYSLLTDKLKKLNTKRCPNCNAPFSFIVVKILGHCEDQEFCIL
jgi:hypothetical protein